MSCQALPWLENGFSQRQSFCFLKFIKCRTGLLPSQCIHKALSLVQARVKRFRIAAAGFPSCSTIKPDLDCSGISRKRPRQGAVGCAVRLSLPSRGPLREDLSTVQRKRSDSRSCRAARSCLDRSRVNKSLSFPACCRHAAGGNRGLLPCPGFGPAFVTNRAATASKDRI